MRHGAAGGGSCGLRAPHLLSDRIVDRHELRAVPADSSTAAVCERGGVRQAAGPRRGCGGGLGGCGGGWLSHFRWRNLTTHGWTKCRENRKATTAATVWQTETSTAPYTVPYM